MCFISRILVLMLIFFSNLNVSKRRCCMCLAMSGRRNSVAGLVAWIWQPNAGQRFLCPLPFNTCSVVGGCWVLAHLLAAFTYSCMLGRWWRHSGWRGYLQCIFLYIYIFISLPMHISFINTFIYIYLFDVYVNIGWLDRLIGKKIDTHICPHRLWRCLPDVIPTGFWDAVGRTGLMKKSRNMSLRLGS